MKKATHLLIAAFALYLAGCDAVGHGRGDADVRAVNFTFYVEDALVNGNVLSDQFDVPMLNRRVVDDGAVLMYFRDQGTWTAMPYTFGVESPDLPAVDYTVSMGFGYELSLLEVFMELSTDEVIGEVEARFAGGVEMKAVVIEDLSYGKQSAVDFSDYEAVKAFYGLSD